MTFDGREAVLKALAKATHILSSSPPGTDGDPVLLQYGDAIAAAPATWIGYLSSTGVYGDTGGAWVDETAPVGAGRRSARAKADLAWQALRPDVRIFRLPRSEEHTSELQSLMRNSYAVFCLKNKKTKYA